jgi:hypothetical protein
LFHRPYGDREVGNNHTMSATTPLLTACGGFLFAVLWMDLMFDARVVKPTGSVLN